MRTFLWFTAAMLPLSGAHGAEQPPSATGVVLVEVIHQGNPLPQAQVKAGDRRVVTGETGEVSLELPAGPVRLEVSHEGFATERADVVVRPGMETRVIVELSPPVALEEEVIVTATRTGKRLQDQPVRVEVLEREEIEEKLLMTPGDVAMLLNETSGLRVQVASPSLGAANVRVQGLRGRYTQILADGLPDRFNGTPPDTTHGPWTGGGHQGGGLCLLRGVGTGWRHQPRFSPTGAGAPRTGGAREPHHPQRDRRRGVADCDTL